MNSTEDFMSRVDSANEKLAREWTPGEEVGLLGFDVKNLFGSMSARQTAKVVRDAYIGSELKVEGVDYESAAMYVRYGYSDAEIRAQKLTRVVPVRRYTRGRAPGVTSAESLHADHTRQEEKWVFPKVEYTETERRHLIGAVLEIAVRTVWENSCYSFGGRYYHQQQGGPTGRRITMAAARIIVGYNIGKEVTDMLQSADIKVWSKSGYVDDLRWYLNLFSDKKWNADTRKFEQLDKSLELNHDELTKYCAEEIRQALESVNPDLKFTVELEQDFVNKQLPTLDTSVWLSQEEGSAPIIKYEFFEKPMNSKFVILEKSAMEYRSKLSILSNDVCRRLFNTKESIPQERKDEILDSFSIKILRSGYNISQTQHILISGIRAYNGRVERAKQSGQGLHRSAESSLGERINKKLFEKTSWYKNGKKKTHKNPQKNVKKSTKIKYQKFNAPKKIKSVLFVPRTGSSKLSRMLREEELKLTEITNYRVKIQEMNGRQFRRILCQKNSFKGLPCSRPLCMVCKGGPDR